jgi:altronate dehydratase
MLYGPGYDQVSTPALVSSGAQIICFTTGRGTGIGNAIAPVIKISSNSELIQRMVSDIDINAGKILDGDASIQMIGEDIFEKIIDVASGDLVKAEENGHREFHIWIEEKITL